MKDIKQNSMEEVIHKILELQTGENFDFAGDSNLAFWYGARFVTIRAKTHIPTVL